MNRSVSAMAARWLPRSMASRVYLIVFAGLMVAQGLLFALMFYERYQTATTVMLDTVEHEVSTSVAMLDRLPAAERADWVGRLQRDNYRFVLGDGEPGTALVNPRAKALAHRIEQEVGPGYHGRADAVAANPARYQVHFTLHDGSPLTLVVIPRGIAPIAKWLPVVLAVQLVVLLGCTWLAARLTTRPLTQLAKAAEAMTPTADGPRMSEAGPLEVAQAATAFNTMQERIARHLKERLHILASISHDLQTPITRMRLRAEGLEAGPVRDKMLGDLHDMEHLVREGVAYARSAHGGAETPVRMDVRAFLESLVYDYQDIGKPVTLSESVAGAAMVRRQALRRVLGNLIDNAIKYAGAAEVSARHGEQGTLCITVCDRGPGIPDDQLEQVLQPFYRLEGSRNRDTGGAGLGLAIAVQLTRAIGGTLDLSNRQGGGLTATVALP